MRYDTGQIASEIARKAAENTEVEILSQNNHGADLIVTWYKLTKDGRYVSVGVNGEFHVPKDQVAYYISV